MGASPYWYFVPYEPDIDAALQKLRQREFEAGRYNPVIRDMLFPLSDPPPRPGRQHDSIDAAIEDSAEEGTCSILDMQSVGDAPDICTVGPLPDEDIEEFFGTTKPTHEAVEAQHDIWEIMNRGEGLYIIVYKDGKPDEIFFGGYSFD